MKVVKGVLGAVVIVLLVIVGVQMFAAESGEAVIVVTRDADGTKYETRLWIVESDDHQWLRCSSASSAWFVRLQQTPTLELRRNDVRAMYTVTVVPEKLGEINALMHDKYGWGDEYVGIFSPRDQAIPIRLDPVATGT